VRSRNLIGSLLFAACTIIWAGRSDAQEQNQTLTVHWDHVVRVSKTTPTLQVVVNPRLRRTSSIHDNVFRALHDLQADYVRYAVWFPYPRLAIAELEPPKNGKTSWDFSLMDPITLDFLDATKGHPGIMSFSTSPQWMYKTEKPVAYPDDPDQAIWDYEQGTEFRDPTMKEVGEYYARLFSWYTKGGFADEYGQRHESRYHSSMPIWEVGNEIDWEHTTSPETYTKLYDQIVESIRRVDPNTKFVGLALARPGLNSRYFEYFLNHKNHKPGIPLDWISYHFYAETVAGESPEVQQFTFFDQADGFLNVVRYIELVRQRLSPGTKTTADEIGSMGADGIGMVDPGETLKPYPNSYWNLSGALYAYVFAEMTRLGIDVVGESQLVGYPGQFPSVSMVDWNTGKPNARYWVLKLLKDNFGPGDRIAEVPSPPPPPETNPSYSTLAVVKANGTRRVLIVNKRDRELSLTIPGAGGGHLEFVDQATAFDPPTLLKINSDKITVRGFGVAVVRLP
jgi:hypothetical protein